MTDRPLISADAMVRALLAGTKRQTRRLATSPLARAQPGDRLWVREAWMSDAPRDGTWPHLGFFDSGQAPLSLIPPVYRSKRYCLFRATWRGDLIGWKPPIFMPRWASRVTLIVTDVRRQRLGDITPAEAEAEGLTGIIRDRQTVWGIPDQDGTPGTGEGGWAMARWQADPRLAYYQLWRGLHPRGEDDPEVVALTFRVQEQNIDDMVAPAAPRSKAA